MDDTDLQHAKMKHDAFHEKSHSKLVSRSNTLLPTARCPCCPCLKCPTALEFLVNPLKLGESRFLRVWDFFCCLMLVYVCFATPLEVAFMDVNVNAQFGVNIGISMLFLGDMLLQFVVPVTIVIPDRGLTKVYSKRVIRRNYLKTWFVIDLISILPFDTVSLLVDSSQTSILGQVRILRLVKLLRLVKGLRLWRRYQTDLAWSYRKMMLAQLFLTVIVVAHWISCLLGAVSRFEAEEVCIGKEAFDREDATCEITWMTKSLKWIGTVRQEGSSQVPVINAYSVSLLTSVTILVHPYFHVVQPVNVLETIMITCMILLGGLLWTRVISKSTGMFTSLDRHNIHYHQMMDDMNETMSHLGLNPKHKTKLRAFFMRMRDLSKQDTWGQIMDRMSPTLRREVTWETNRVWARRVPCLIGCTHVMITEVAEALKSHRFAQREYFGEPYTLYIMQIGKATRWSKKGATGLQVKGPGDFWGEEQIMLSNPNLLTSNIALAVSFLEVKSISRDQFDAICHYYPENWDCLKRHYYRYVFQAGVWHYKTLVANAETILECQGRRRMPEQVDISKADLKVLDFRLGDQIHELAKAAEVAKRRRQAMPWAGSSGFDSGEGSVTFQDGQHEDDQHSFHARRALRDKGKLVPKRRLCFLEQVDDGDSQYSPRYHQLTVKKEHRELQALHKLLEDQGKRIEEEVEAVRKEVQEKAFVLSAQQRALMELIQQRWPADTAAQRPGQSRRRNELARAAKRRGIFSWSRSPQSRKNGAAGSQGEALQVRVGVIGESRGSHVEAPVSQARSSPPAHNPGVAGSPVQASGLQAENTEDNSVGSNEVHGSPINTMVFDLSR